MATNRYCIDVAKREAGCKECKQKIVKDTLRIAKIVPNPFTDAGGDMKQWFHVRCAFQKLTRARATTKKIENPDDLEGWDEISDEHKAEVLKCMSDFSISGKPTTTPVKKAVKRKASPGGSPSGSVRKSRSRSSSPKRSPSPSGKKSPRRSSPSPKRSSRSPSGSRKGSKDDSFREFRRLCTNIADEPSYKEKTAIVADFFENGSDKRGFHGDLYLWITMLLPSVDKTVYNLQNKQLIKLFSRILAADQEEMLEDLEKGDVAETVRLFFEDSDEFPPAKKSTLTLQEVDGFLKDLSKVSKEEEQIQVLKKVTKRSTANDLKMFIRLIKHDLRMNAGPKPILSALHPTAYDAFQASHDLKDVVRRAKLRVAEGSTRGLRAKTTLLTPVKPMLAQACRSVAEAFKKCPNGVYVEIKYDGERVQIHKKGQEFSYFSRSLKPVMPYKVIDLKDYIPKAFPHGNDLIIDSEILLVNHKGKPLPFGTLGAHKKASFKDATVCLFVFDCLQFNDEDLMKKPFAERRKFLQENMKPIKNHVMFSEQKFVMDPAELKKMIQSVINQGLEGLVIKDKLSIYEPGKRHWLKVKKDYLKKGAMADSADLVVLGAYYGTGKKGGMMSIFLMGCLNNKTKKWCTVTKVHGGHDDDTLEGLQDKLHMKKISKDPSKVPQWLNVSKSIIPDFVAVDPMKSQVWEITGAEFTKTELHTASGISIRFPRVTRIRDDKTSKEATTLTELQKLYEVSKVTTDLIGLGSSSGNSRKSGSDSDHSSSSKRSQSPAKGSRSRSRSRSKSKSPSRKRSRSPAKSSRSRSRSSKSRSRSRSKSPSRKKKQQRKSRSRSQTKKVDSGELTRTLSHNLTSDNEANSSQISGFVIPSVFTGVKLFLPPSIEQFETLRRYFIAFDGILLKDHELKDATHIVMPTPGPSTSKDDSCSEAIKVNPDWLWDCIKLKKMVPERLYRPGI